MIFSTDMASGSTGAWRTRRNHLIPDQEMVAMGARGLDGLYLPAHCVFRWPVDLLGYRTVQLL